MSNLRWIVSYVMKVKLMFTLSIVLMVLESLSYLSTIGLQKIMIDDVFVDGQYHRFIPVLLWIATAYVSYSILFTFGPHTMHKSVAYIQDSMSKHLMRTMHKTAIGQLQKERTGNYVYHFTTDIPNTANLIGNDTPRGIQQVVNAIVLIVIIAAASPLLLVGVTVLSIVYIFLGKYLGPKRKLIAKEVNRHKSDWLVHIEEGVSSTREVVSFHRHEWETKIYNKLFTKYYDSVMTEGKLINKQMLLSDPLKWMANLLVLGYGGYAVMQGNFSLGMFLITYQFTSQLMDSFQNVYQYFMGLAGKMSSVERVRNVLESEMFADGHQKLHKSIQKIQFDCVTFSYSDTSGDILKNLLFEIPVGSKIAFVGSSGGGKSTIAQLFIRFFDPTSGDILINGISLRNLKRAGWMKRLAIVFQEPYLFPDTIRSNLVLGMHNVAEGQIREACKCSQIDDYIMDLPDGYDTVIGERGITLSGGQRQRIALARALMRNPEILILDEATSALDLETERQIQRNLDEIRHGRTTIIIAHRLSTIQNADVIYVFDKGTITGSGTHEELLATNSVYQELVYKKRAEED